MEEFKITNDRLQFFKQLNNFFDRIYVITLRRATDRHQHVAQELNGLKYELFFGKDKQEFKVEELIQNKIYDDDLAKKHHRYGKPMPEGMIGCSWSHVEVYKDIMAKGYQKVLIMEDDVVVDEKYMHLLSHVLKEMPQDWELVYFGFAEKERTPTYAGFKKTFYHLLRVFGGIRYTHKTIKNLYPKKVSKYVYKAGYHDCTHAYGITVAGAKKLLQLQTPISFFPDNLLAHAVTNEIVKGFIVLPKLINQQYQVGTNTQSYIHQ